MFHAAEGRQALLQQSIQEDLIRSEWWAGMPESHWGHIWNAITQTAFWGGKGWTHSCSMRESEDTSHCRSYCGCHATAHCDVMSVFRLLYLLKMYRKITRLWTHHLLKTWGHFNEQCRRRSLPLMCYEELLLSLLKVAVQPDGVLAACEPYLPTFSSCLCTDKRRCTYHAIHFGWTMANEALRGYWRIQRNSPEVKMLPLLECCTFTSLSVLCLQMYYLFCRVN